MTVSRFPLEPSNNASRLACVLLVVVVAQIQWILRQQKVTRLVDNWLQRVWDESVISTDFKRIVERILLVEDGCLAANVFRFQETAEIVCKLVVNVEVNYLTVCLWEQRVAIKVNATTVTT